MKQGLYLKICKSKPFFVSLRGKMHRNVQTFGAFVLSVRVLGRLSWLPINARNLTKQLNTHYLIKINKYELEHHCACKAGA